MFGLRPWHGLFRSATAGTGDASRADRTAPRPTWPEGYHVCPVRDDEAGARVPEHRRPGLGGALALEACARVGELGGHEVYINGEGVENYPLPTDVHGSVGSGASVTARSSSPRPTPAVEREEAVQGPELRPREPSTWLRSWADA